MRSVKMITFLNDDTIENEIFRRMTNKNLVHLPLNVIEELAKKYDCSIKKIYRVINKFIEEDICIRTRQGVLFINPDYAIRRSWVNRRELLAKYKDAKEGENKESKELMSDYAELKRNSVCPESTYLRDSL